MLQTRAYYEKLLTDLQEEKKSVNERLSACPKGELHRFNDKVRGERFVQSYYEDGKRHRVTVPKDSPTFALLGHKEYLKEALRILEQNEVGLTRLLAHYEDYTADLILARLSGSVAAASASEYSLLTGKLTPDTRIVPWSEAHYEQSGYLPQHKIHTTTRGLKVRSKSEVSIAEIMYKLGIQFRYEEILRVGNRTYIPDFTIRRPDGRRIYYEHCGLPTDPAYWEHHKKKLSQYEQIGIYPWDNLIVTYDNSNGELDLKFIELLLCQKVLDQ